MNLKETQIAIKYVKDNFQQHLVKKLNLLRVSAPLFLKTSSGLNDGLSGVEKAIEFHVNDISEDVEIIHSLAKWKRFALSKYQMGVGEGIYTDMNAIRKDEHLDFYHSIYVDQWDWEIVISNNQRTLSFLKRIVKKIYNCIFRLAEDVQKRYPQLINHLPNKIKFISTKELESLYPNLSRKERENKICQEFGAVFLYKIGHKLKDKMPHDFRAADYDDWKLNGDILVYNHIYNMAFELSSMGIRVNKESLINQLKIKKELYKLENDYCKAILNDMLPLTIGGGIGQSRLCMFILQKQHIGEVQSSIWGDDEIKMCNNKNIKLL